MRHTLLVTAILAVLSIPGSGAFAVEPGLEAVLGFELPPQGEAPTGWGGGPPETLHFDGEVVHTGRGAARIERDAGSQGEFSSLTRGLPLDFSGKLIELRGYLRTEDVEGLAGFWLRQDGPAGVLRFTSMLVEGRGLRGSTDWAQYSVQLPVDEAARSLVFGFLLSGSGKVWADDLELRVDGKPLAEAPERVIEKTVLDTDHEFDGGSGIDLASLTGVQIDNLAVLGRVWGFLKYHHPRVASGELHWDYELFRVLPKVLAAADREAGNRTLARWVEKLGVPEGCDPCARPPEDVHLRPRLDWIGDAELLGAELSGHLETLHARRFAGDDPFYLSQVPGVGNPVFDREPVYPHREPDAGTRILALFRLWNIIEYWFPYRDLLDDDWPSVLREALPRMVRATDRDAYSRELLAVIVRVGDGHANLFPLDGVRPPHGTCRWPVGLRFVEGRATVSKILEGSAGEGEGGTEGLEIGDVVETVDGRSVEALVEEWKPYYSASNPAARLRGIVRSLPRGPCGESVLGIERRGETKSLTVERLADLKPGPDFDDRPGPTFQRLSEDIAYLKLSDVRARDIGGYLEQAAGTRGLVVDVRNYPAESVIHALGSRLIEEPTPFARFTAGDPDNPGAFTWTESMSLQPAGPRYPGRVAILVDEVSISHAEFTAMALSAGPRAVVVGSTTAGADGNVSRIPLPGGLRTAISGIGVFYPDKTPTQRVGVRIDIPASPTVEGLREGRDEVLEAALRHLLGPEADEGEIRRLARRP